MAVWHARGDTLDVSVNLSGRQLDDDAIVEYVSDALKASGLDASSLILEISDRTSAAQLDDSGPPRA